MQVFVIQLIAVYCFSAIAALGQTPERSHVERFSTPEVHAARIEAEATAKLSRDANDHNALNARALARMRLGRYTEASADLSRAVALKPDGAVYHANLGFVLWKLGRTDEAIRAEQTALKLDEKNAAAHYHLGRFLLRIGSSEQQVEASAHLRRSLELEPNQYEARFELITAYRALGDTPRALNQLELLRDARPSEPRLFYMSALLATDRNDLEAAIRDFREALRRDALLFDAWRDLGLAYIKQKRWSDAAQAFGEWAQRQPGSIDAAYLHALALFNASRPDDAERETRRALRLNGGAAEAHTLLGVILASRGNANPEAADALMQAVALKPMSFDAHFYLGRVLYAIKDHAGAVSELRAAVNLNPQHAEARFFFATALESAGESKLAMTEYEELVRLDSQSVIGQVGMGALLLKQGKMEEAIAVLKRAISLDQKSFEAHWSLGRALVLTERFSEAIEVLKTAVSLAPYRADAHYQLGLSLRRLGRAEEAAREFAIVEKLNTEFRTSSASKQ